MKINQNEKNYFTILFFKLSISNCLQTTKCPQAETIEKRGFKQTIPFREMNGIIVIKVKIGDKIEDFILDTGAMTHIDDDLMKKSNIQPSGK